jgi:GNAT superfamily N-acetyltransferase
MNIENDADLARAVEDNEAAFLLALGRAGGGVERKDAEIHWTVGGAPIAYHNCVVRADLRAGRADMAIEEFMALLRERGVPGSWHVGPSMRPPDLAERLVAHGFDGGPEPGMAIQLDTHSAVDPVASLHIDRVVRDDDLEAYAGVLSLGFGEGPKEATWVREMFSRIGLGDNVPWRHYLASIDGVAAATVSLFFAANVAGVYFVCTAPDFRRRGLGEAITHAALADARALGFRTAVLGSSRMGHALYERMGFRDVCDISVYEWSP